MVLGNLSDYMALDTILLAVGAGDAVRTEALTDAVNEIATPTGATVVLAHVFTEEEFEDVSNQLNIEAGADPTEVAERHATIRDIISNLDDGIEFEVRGAIGKRGEAIVEVAKAVEADRVIVGGRKRSPTGKAVFGSTAQEVMLSAPCPVTFVRSDD